MKVNMNLPTQSLTLTHTLTHTHISDRRTCCLAAHAHSEAESRSLCRHTHARACSHTGWLACESCLQHPGKWRKRQRTGSRTASWIRGISPLVFWPAETWTDLEKGTVGEWTALSRGIPTVCGLWGYGIAERWHRRTDAPVVLGRASGATRWGRGRRCRKTVIPNHSSGVILQPDRLIQACLHLSVSFLHPLHPCFPSFSDVHAVVVPPYTSSFSSFYYRALSVLPSLKPSCVPSHIQHLDFLLPCFRLLRFQHPFSLAFVLRHFSLSTFLCALQTVPGPFSGFLPFFVIHPSTSTLHSDSPFGSVRSANGIRCSLYSSRIQGAPGLPVRGDPLLQTRLRLEPDSDLQ